MDDLARAVVAEARDRLLRHYPAQVRAALEALSEEQIWWRPNDAANAVGNLVLHVCGSTRHFLGRGVGGGEYVRDRPAEFAEKGPVPRAELFAVLDRTVAEAERVLATLEPGRLLEISDRAGEPQSVLALILRTTHHWAVHTGQIVYAAKAARERVFDELWIRTLKGHS